MSQVNFKSIKFGFASAEVESSHEPHLLLEGYYDEQQLTAAALGKDKFLFLGYKGAGKSAIGKRLELKASEDPELFVTSAVLRDFPFKAFQKVGSTESEPESRFPTAWAWLLLLQIIESFSTDNGGNWATSAGAQASLAVLKDQGLIPATDLKSLVLKSSKTSFKAGIPGLLSLMNEADTGSQELSFLTLVNHLRSLVRGFSSSSQHIIVIDGLDDILTQREVQYQSLAALLQEVARLNSDLSMHAIPAKVILLCRTDLFELLPDANKNKLRRDSSVALDWYHDTRAPQETALVGLADLRIGLSTGDRTRKLTDFLPPSIDGEPTLQALLNLTRHTPRDFIQLIHSIQGFARNDGRLAIDDILSGMRAYSIEYFLPEIKDELVGSGSPEEIEAILDLISAMRSREFKYSALRSFAANSGHKRLEDLDIDRMLRVLYDRSAIGTVSSHKGRSHYTFKYRNRNSTLGFPDVLMLHKGIWKALNVA